MNRRKVRRVAAAVIAGVLAIIWLCGFITVNVKNPPVPVVTLYEGDPYISRDVSFTVTGHRMIDGESVKSLLMEVNPDQYRELTSQRDSQDIRMLLLDMRVKNLGSEKVEGAFGGIVSAGFLSPVDTLSYMYPDVNIFENSKALGEDWDTLAPGEEKDWTLFFYLESDWMSPKWWAQVDTMLYELILDDYPVEYRFSTAPRPE